MPNRPNVVWLHSLARSGSSVAVYAAAAPFGWPVADEVMGPWDRTGPPYNYPRAQRRLVNLFKQHEHRLTPEVVELANRVFEKLAGGRGTVVSKWPHLRPSPEEFAEAFPADRKVYLVRNPLHRLNSLHRRGWTNSFGPRQDLDRYRQFARWWQQQPARLRYDDLKADPHAFFRRLYECWEVDFDDSHVNAAVSYMRGNYHDSSLEKSERRSDRVLSESEFALPREAIDLYVQDPFIREFMAAQGWSLDPADYGFADAPAEAAQEEHA